MFARWFFSLYFTMSIGNILCVQMCAWMGWSWVCRAAVISSSPGSSLHCCQGDVTLTISAHLSLKLFLTHSALQRILSSSGWFCQCGMTGVWKGNSIHKYTEEMLGISLYSYLYAKPGKNAMSFLLSLMFSLQ
jgi:hypothetical protein